MDTEFYAQRAVAALERIAAALEAALEPEPDAPERGEDPEPTVDGWAPRKGGRAALFGEPVLVDRLYESEGEAMAVVVNESGESRPVAAVLLGRPQ